MSKEILNINKFVLAGIMSWSQEDQCTPEQAKECDNYEVIQETINSVDEGDGGSDNTVVIKRKSDNKYFSFDYQDWDINWECGHFDDFNPDIEEVFPKEITTIIYE
jgi:hypothetical protein